MTSMLPPQLPGPPGQPVPGGLADQMYAPPEQPQAQQDGGLSALQDVIESFPPLLAALHDPQDVKVAADCLARLTAVQARMMGAQGPSGPASY